MFRYIKKNKNYSVFTVRQTNKMFGQKKRYIIPLFKNEKEEDKIRNKIYYECGVVYCLRLEEFKKKNIRHNSTHTRLMRLSLLDMNTNNDFKIAKLLCKKK